MPQAMQNLIDQYITEVRNIYGLCLQKIILFGSYARGDYHADCQEPGALGQSLHEEQADNERDSKRCIL